MVHSDRSGPTRRRFLHRGATAGAGLGAASLTGCLGLVPPLGDGAEFGRVDVPQAGEPTYREWIPAPSVLPDGVEYRGAFDEASSVYTEAPYPHLYYAEPAHVAAIGRSWFSVSKRVGQHLDWVGSGVHRFDRALVVGPVTVVEGDLGTDTVAEALAGTGYDATAEYGGFDVYERSDDPRTIAVGDDALVFARTARQRVVVERVIDARAGRVPRRHETDEVFEQVTTEIGAHPRLRLPAGIPYRSGRDVFGDALFGATATIPTETTQYQSDVFLFPGDVPEDDIRHVLSDESHDWIAVNEVRVDGSIARVNRRFDSVAMETDNTYPVATWGIGEKGDGTVTFVHEAGDPYDPSLLGTVVGDESPDVGLDGRDGPVTAGDRISVDVPGDARTVELLYFPKQTEANLLIEADLTEA